MVVCPSAPFESKTGMLPKMPSFDLTKFSCKRGPEARTWQPGISPMANKSRSLSNLAEAPGNSGERQIAGVQSPSAIRSAGHCDTSPQPFANSPSIQSSRQWCRSATSSSSIGILSKLMNRVGGFGPLCRRIITMLSVIAVFWLKLMLPGWWQVNTRLDVVTLSKC